PPPPVRFPFKLPNPVLKNMLHNLTESLTKLEISDKFFHIKLERMIRMNQKNSIRLAKTILLLDKLRDELYEELMKNLGSRGHELLRKLQNL
ncbi:hypothetical protein, partial [Neobacillus citreus]